MQGLEFVTELITCETGGMGTHQTRWCGQDVFQELGLLLRLLGGGSCCAFIAYLHSGQCSLLFVIHAGSAKVVYWLAIRHFLFQFVGESFGGKFKKLIALHLALPALQCFSFAFQAPAPAWRVLLVSLG